MVEVSMPRELLELLQQFAEAYKQPRQDSAVTEKLMFYALGNATTVDHHGLPDGGLEVSEGDLEELSDYGLIDIAYGNSLNSGSFRVTNEGYNVVEQVEQHDAAIAAPAVVPAEGQTLGFDWGSDVLPVLHAVHKLWTADPSPRGVSKDAIKAELGRDEDDTHTSVVLRKLKEAGFLDGRGAWQTEGPVLCEPTAKTFELLAGWPTERGDMALARLVVALEARIAATEDPEEKSKLGSVLSSVRDVSEGVMAGVLTKMIAG